MNSVNNEIQEKYIYIKYYKPIRKEKYMGYCFFFIEN